VNACIVAIGDEIVGGLTTDTNSGFLSRLLRSAGVEVVGLLGVPDDEDAIVRALERALESAELAVTTGGLGPTADDLTAACVARLAATPLRLDEPSLRAIEERFHSRGLEMPSNNRRQAMVPAGAEIVPNPEGTAPGFICPVEIGGVTRHVATLPGVPREMRRMAEESLLPWVSAHSGGLRIGSRTFSIFGVSESRLDELLAGAIPEGEGRLSFRAAFPRLQARVTVTAPTDSEVDRRLDEHETVIRARLGDLIYALGDEGLEETVGRLLRGSGLSLAVAESCTGGLIGHRITDVPGSSEYFRLGVVAYENDMKVRTLGVAPGTLERHGAVSEETVREMARGVRAVSGADVGIATSGIAGPGGGTGEKPVGTVCIGLSSPAGEWSRRYQLGSRGREWIKGMTAQLALDQLRRQLAEAEGAGGSDPGGAGRP
jgi:nicotinamide-nucleotide amidase